MSTDPDGAPGEGGALGVGAPTHDGAGTPAPYVPLRFLEVRLDLPSPHPLLVLEEADAPWRRLEVPIGMAEGVAIAYAARGLPTPRPLTHELFVQLLELAGMTVETVRVVAVRGRSYSAELVVSGPTGAHTVACRLSDGVALALRQRVPAPMTAAPSVLEAAGLGGTAG
ncbi:MAG TPA: bifunctional nuclease family protein [Acidimicrobiales bacterium]|nr:bifunctional nuclease family protein [Acidimicrobiales bacterium]